MASVDELWLVDFGTPHPAEPAHHRPALVVGPPEVFGSAFPFVIVLPLTTARRDLSFHVEVEARAVWLSIGGTLSFRSADIKPFNWPYPKVTIGR